MHINSPPRIKKMNVKHGISGCNVWEVDGEGRVDGIPEVFCSACKTQHRGASSPHVEHIYGADGTDWMELPRQKAKLFQSVPCCAEKCEDSQSVHYPHNPYFPADGRVRQLCLSEENLFLHEQIIEKASSVRLDSHTPALSGNYYPSGPEGQMQYQHAFLDETLEKATFCLPALESVNRIMLLIMVGLGLSISQVVLFLTHKDIVIAIGCFVSVCCSIFSFFCAILVAGSPSWIGDCTFNDQSFQEAELIAFIVNLLLVIQATMLLLSSLCLRAVLAERKRIASFDRVTTI